MNAEMWTLDMNEMPPLRRCQQRHPPQRPFFCYLFFGFRRLKVFFTHFLLSLCVNSGLKVVMKVQAYYFNFDFSHVQVVFG